MGNIFNLEFYYFIIVKVNNIYILFGNIYYYLFI